MTKMTDKPLSDAELELLFQAVQDTAPVPSEELWQRVHADADAAMPPPATRPASTARRPVQVGLVAGLLAAIGGWPSMAGLATAAIAGVWIGFSNPAALSELNDLGLLPGDTSAQVFDLEDFDPGLGDFADLLDEG